MKIKKTLTILAYLLLFFINIRGIHAQERRGYKRSVDPIKSRLVDADMTNGLSDNEMEMALNDLSLSDLNLLSRLVDRSNAENDYDADSFLNSNDRAPTFYGIKSPNDPIGNEDDDSNNDDEHLNTVTNNFAQLQIPIADFREENPRTKRAYVDRPKEITVDEEYLKQLENSFPRDQEQDDHEPEEKKGHVRVKRIH